MQSWTDFKFYNNTNIHTSPSAFVLTFPRNARSTKTVYNRYGWFIHLSPHWIINWWPVLKLFLFTTHHIKILTALVLFSTRITFLNLFSLCLFSSSKHYSLLLKPSVMLIWISRSKEQKLAFRQIDKDPDAKKMNFSSPLKLCNIKFYCNFWSLKIYIIF